MLTETEYLAVQDNPEAVADYDYLDDDVREAIRDHAFNRLQVMLALDGLDGGIVVPFDEVEEALRHRDYIEARVVI